MCNLISSSHDKYIGDNVDKILNCFPIFNIFLKEITFGEIVGIESINIERFQQKTFIYEIDEFFGYGDVTPSSREIDTKLTIKVCCRSSYWKFEKSKISSQFVRMFRRQFNFLDLDKCLVEISDQYDL